MNTEINAFPEYSFEIGEDGKRHNMYRGVDIGFGGYVYSEPGSYVDVALLDCQSQHPTSAIVMEAFGEDTKRYEEIYAVRAAIKHYDYDYAKRALGGVLAPYLVDEKKADQLATALKLCLNQPYGISFASFQNPFRDPRNQNNFIALRGALFMKTLQDEVVKKGFKVCHIKTDSIKIPNATDEIISFVKSFGLKYGYILEHEATYDRMCLVNKAVYIAKYDQYGIRNKKGKHAGEWTATGAQFQNPYIFKTLFSKEPITFEDICQVKEAQKGAIYLDMNEALPEDVHDYHFVGKIGQFCPIKVGCGGGELVIKRDDKYVSASGAKGYRWLESEQVRLMSKEDDIDMTYFHSLVDEAIDTISEYDDFEHFVGEQEYVPIN